MRTDGDFVWPDVLAITSRSTGSSCRRSSRRTWPRRVGRRQRTSTSTAWESRADHSGALADDEPQAVPRRTRDSAVRAYAACITKKCCERTRASKEGGTRTHLQQLAAPGERSQRRRHVAMARVTAMDCGCDEPATHRGSSWSGGSIQGVRHRRASCSWARAHRWSRTPCRDFWQSQRSLSQRAPPT